jgi:hypothetical protein
MDRQSMRGDKDMYALLVLDQKGGNANVLVSLKAKSMQRRLNLLLEKNKSREAFDLLKDQAEVHAFLPAGAKLPLIPQVTLIEDLL